MESDLEIKSITIAEVEDSAVAAPIVAEFEVSVICSAVESLTTTQRPGTLLVRLTSEEVEDFGRLCGRILKRIQKPN